VQEIKKPEIAKIVNRPKRNETHIGHIVYEIDYAHKLHIMPVSNENMKNGLCRSVMVIEKHYSGEKSFFPRFLINGSDKVDGEKRKYFEKTFWVDNKFKVEVTTDV
jgi:hypothetical protein